MKKLLSIMIAVCMCIIPAFAGSATVYAAGSFSDIEDADTAVCAEVLKLMGAIDGYSDGRFNPDGTLTRAHFCKMAVYAMSMQSELSKYTTMTIFPDVRSGHWAASYINLSCKGLKIINGALDGKFYPSNPITAVQAIAILMRSIGYSDASDFPIWPESYINKAAEIGMLTGTGITLDEANSSITRAQAAKLFVNALSAEGPSGSSYYSLSEPVVLESVDGANGTLKAGGVTYALSGKAASSALVGSYGRVVSAGGKAVTFIPESDIASNGLSASVLIAAYDGDDSGFALIAGSSNYKIFKNGLPASKSDIKKNDTAIYSAVTNSVLVSDTKVYAYYEDCAPNPKNPTSITILGTQFNVIPGAADSISRFKPGQMMTVLLSADGRIAGALDGISGNAIGICLDDGLFLMNGTSMIKINGQYKYMGSSADDSVGAAVSISSYGRDDIRIYPQKSNIGDLDYASASIGRYEIAENARIFDHGEAAATSGLTGIIPSSQISYVRLNWANKADFIVLRTGSEKEGVCVRIVPEKDGDEYVRAVLSNGRMTQTVECSYPFERGGFYYVKLTESGIGRIEETTKLEKIGAGSLSSGGSVIILGKSYSVDLNAMCYNPDNDSWMTFERAINYADCFNLYCRDNTIMLLEIAY